MNAALRPSARYVAEGITLTDQDGCLVNMNTFRGMYALVFFGFTRCRVICPRVLGRLSSVLDRLGAIADRVQPVYITVDPARDSPEVLKQFLEVSYPRFLGLTGTVEQIDSVRRPFQVYSGERIDSQGARVITHSTITYLLDPSGSLADHWLESVSEDSLVLRLTRQLAPRCI
jgi:protein SCO1/2